MIAMFPERYSSKVVPGMERYFKECHSPGREFDVVVLAEFSPEAGTLSRVVGIANLAGSCDIS
jgi:hypothetical protein